MRLDAAHAAPRVDRDALERKVRSGLASAQQVSDCQADIAAFDAAEAGPQEAAIQGISEVAERWNFQCVGAMSCLPGREGGGR